MNRRIGFSLPCVLLLAMTVWAGPAQAERLTPQTARVAMHEALVDYFGSTYTEAGFRWLDCPEVYGYGYSGIAGCMSEFRKGSTWRFVSGSVDGSLYPEISLAAQWKRKWKRCRNGHLGRMGIHGVLWTNDRRCVTASLMSSDLAYAARSGKPKRLRWAAWHGTNMIGFGRIADYRCVPRRRGNLYNVRCRNSLGDAFRLRMRVRAFRG